MKPMWVYLDTSTYLKLYVNEQGSNKVRILVRKNNTLSSAILLTECFSALSRKRQAGEINESVFNNLISQIKKDLQYVEIVRLTDEVLTRAEEVALYSTARALDAIHIASALMVKEVANVELSFVTSDSKQQKVAKELGLKTSFVG